MIKEYLVPQSQKINSDVRQALKNVDCQASGLVYQKTTSYFSQFQIAFLNTQPYDFVGRKCQNDFMISQAKKYGHRFQISMPFGESLKMKVRWVCQGHTYSLHNLSLFYHNAFWQTTLSDRFISFFKLTCPHCYFMRLNLKKGVSLILPSSIGHRVFICIEHLSLLHIVTFYLLLFK